MTVTGSQKALLKRLKKQIRVLQRKETQARNRLRTTLKKMRKLGKTYKSKLVSKMRVMKNKIAETRAVTYAKVAADIERHMLKTLEAKGKSLKNLITKLEKKHISKTAKLLTKKAGKVKKARKAKAMPVKKMAKRSKQRAKRSRKK